MFERPSNTLSSYVPWLLQADEEWRLRIVLHDWAMWWFDTDLTNRLALVETEPATISKRWDALLAAWVEHHCWHDCLRAPDWVFEPSRYLESYWYPGRDLRGLRAEAVVHSSAAFEAHGVLLPVRELEVV